MIRLLRVALSTAARRVIAQPGNAVAALVFYVAVMSVMSALWRAAAEAGGGEVVGYTALAVTWYAATAEASTVSLNIRMIEIIGDDIASGAIATELLRPASVLAVRVAEAVGTALPRLAMCILTGAVLSILYVGGPPDVAAALLAVPSLVLAITCNVLAQHAVAGAAFWLRDVGASWFLYQKLVFVLGGMLIPLQVLPDALERVALVLPFMAMSYAPARLASGHLEPWLLAAQAAWLVVLAFAARAVFAAGERRLQVVGG